MAEDLTDEITHNPAGWSAFSGAIFLNHILTDIPPIVNTIEKCRYGETLQSLIGENCKNCGAPLGSEEE